MSAVDINPTSKCHELFYSRQKTKLKMLKLSNIIFLPENFIWKSNEYKIINKTGIRGNTEHVNVTITVMEVRRVRQKYVDHKLAYGYYSLDNSCMSDETKCTLK